MLNQRVRPYRLSNTPGEVRKQNNKEKNQGQRTSCVAGLDTYCERKTTFTRCFDMMFVVYKG